MTLTSSERLSAEADIRTSTSELKRILPIIDRVRLSLMGQHTKPSDSDYLDYLYRRADRAALMVLRSRKKLSL